MTQNASQQNKAATAGPKIGLALSGGGFRAAIYHLGVIRRLEELGLMPLVNVISTVSGGSIIGAYYVVEMERRLREKRGQLAEGRPLIEVRVELFREIARDFFKATDNNLRSRALIFAPFYHPVAFLKMLRSDYNRSDLMQAEYDRWFFRHNTIDQLPSVMHDKVSPDKSYLAGPKLVVNTTSLLSGERVGFWREPISGIKELSRVNKNVLPLSRIVGASAGLPGLFPPTHVSGDMLMDGGICDNQGLEGLWQEDCNMLLVSDASGQMRELHRIQSGEIQVLSRANAIFQFQIRKKLLDGLRQWREKDESRREFAFTHLHLNLKDRPEVTHRLPSEYIPAVARLRTDFDQFSLVEREALMYHGYTLIDAQLKKHCPKLMATVRATMAEAEDIAPLTAPPLFQDHQGKKAAGAIPAARRQIKNELEAGSKRSFLLRAIKKHPAKGLFCIATIWAIPLLLFFTPAFKHVETFAHTAMRQVLGGWRIAEMPPWLLGILHHLGEYLAWPITRQGVAVLVTFLLTGYVLFFFTCVIMRRRVRVWDMSAYQRLTRVMQPENSGPASGHSGTAPPSCPEEQVRSVSPGNR